MTDRVRDRAALRLGLPALRGLLSTLRVSTTGELPREGPPLLYAFWHGEQQLLLPIRDYRVRKLCVLVSRSADGELQRALLERLGLSVERGSSSRGGAAALRALVRRVRAGHDVALAVDGPRGPCGVAKSGLSQLARLTGAATIPLRADASRCWRVRGAWDGYVVPTPFAAVRIACGPAIAAPDTRAGVERHRAALDAALRQLGPCRCM